MDHERNEIRETKINKWILNIHKRKPIYLVCRSPIAVGRFINTNFCQQIKKNKRKTVQEMVVVIHAKCFWRTKNCFFPSVTVHQRSHSINDDCATINISLSSQRIYSIVDWCSQSKNHSISMREKNFFCVQWNEKKNKWRERSILLKTNENNRKAKT